jgi:hypothetical protein
MLEELERRNYSQNTARAYLRTMDDIVRHFGRPAEQLGAEDIREYQAYLFRERHLAANTVNQPGRAGSVLRRRKRSAGLGEDQSGSETGETEAISTRQSGTRPI